MFRSACLGVLLFAVGGCAPPEIFFDELPEAVREGLRREARLAARYAVSEGVRLAHLALEEEGWASRTAGEDAMGGEAAGSAGEDRAVEPTSEASVPERRTTSVRRSSSAGQRVRAKDVNRASRRQLERVPGVGPALAGRIIEGRPYAQVDDLLRVSGIGERTLERMRPWFVVGEE